MKPSTFALLKADLPVMKWISFLVLAVIAYAICDWILFTSVDHSRYYCSPDSDHALCIKFQKAQVAPCRIVLLIDILFQGQCILNEAKISWTPSSHDSVCSNITTRRDLNKLVITTEVDEKFWTPMGSANREYRENCTVVSLTYHPPGTQNKDFSFQFVLFKDLLATRVLNHNWIGTASSASRFSLDFRLSHFRGFAFLDGGDEKGYYKADLDSLQQFKWRGARQATPIAFQLYTKGTISKEVIMAVSEGCNDFTRNVRLQPRKLDFNSFFQPREGFELYFPELESNFDTSPYLVLHFSSSAAALGNHFDKAGLLCGESRNDTDYSWAQPGKVIREISLSNETSVEYLKLCSNANVRYLLFDAGWYGQERDPKSDPLDPRPTNGKLLNISFISDFGSSLNPPVYTIFYINDIALMDEAKVEKIAVAMVRQGVKGIKMGFVDVRSNYNMKRVIGNLRIFGKHKLVVNIHDAFREYYIQHMYPYLLSVEGVRGSEHPVDSVQHQMILPFTRMLAGRMDYTFTTSNESLMAHGNISVLYEVALPFVLYNGLNHLFWYEPWPNIQKQLKDDAYSLWVEMPATYERSYFLESKIGVYVSLARQSPGKDRWFVVALTDVDRMFYFDFFFLGNDEKYNVTFFRESGIEFADSILVTSSFRHFENVKKRTGFIMVLRKSDPE